MAYSGGFKGLRKYAVAQWTENPENFIPIKIVAIHKIHTHPYLTTSLPPPKNPNELKLSQTLVTDEGEEKQERTEIRIDGRDGGWGLEIGEMESECLRSDDRPKIKLTPCDKLTN